MDGEEDWNALLNNHPIFTYPKPASATKDERPLELSLNTLSEFTKVDPSDDGLTPSERRQITVIKDSDIIVAAGSEIRMASLGDSRLNKSQRKSHKTLNTPNVTFDIHQIALNPNGKFLAVAGAFEVAVIVLPRTGFTRLVPTTVDCKSIRVGQYYHASTNSPPIAKIDWHPWGDGGTTLLVMTVDGKLREYDIAVDIEEPQQVLSFIPDKTRKSYLAKDDAERLVASFTLGKGKADWGPLSVYALMKSGDIYAICPYMPQNAAIPSSYVHALECFVAAKQEFLTQASTSGTASGLTGMYDYQHKYVTALVKQLPPGTTFPSKSRTILMHPPAVIRTQPVRQGPFLLQPAPLMLADSEGGDATDIVYLAFGHDGVGKKDTETERLGIVLVAFQDGKVDVFLDVEKVEARWERKHASGDELPMMAVYETIDLGLVTLLNNNSPTAADSPLLDLLQANHPVLLRDPIHDETVYVYHAFGVHALQLGPLLQNLANALRDDISNDGDDSLAASLEKAGSTAVQPILTTFSVESKSSNPIVGVAIPNDVYLTYSIFILTSAMRNTTLPLILQSDDSPLNVPSPSANLAIDVKSSTSVSTTGPPAYVSVLAEPFEPPPILASNGPPSRAVLDTPPPQVNMELTPDTMRYLGNTVKTVMDQIHEVFLASRTVEMRAQLQKSEFARQQTKVQDILKRVEKLQGERQELTKAKLEKARDSQRALMSRIDRILGAMMKNASPEVSEHEKKWFEELKRMKDEVVGRGRYDQDSLAARAKLLRRELDRLLPNLKELQQKEEKLRQKMLADGTSGLGVSQAFALGERASTERTRIGNLERDILRLAAQMDVTLGKPPQGREGASDEL